MSTPGIMERLEAMALEAGGFGHREHLQAAFEALSRDEFIVAAARYAAAISRFAEAAGAAEKYSVTITLAYLALIAERMEEKRWASFDAFLAANRDLLDRPLEGWYTPERLHSRQARRLFLLPDRLPCRNDEGVRPRRLSLSPG